MGLHWCCWGFNFVSARAPDPVETKLAKTGPIGPFLVDAFCARTSRLMLAIVLCLTACAPLADSSRPASMPPAQAIHVVSHGWHTGFVIPASDIQEHLPALRQRFGRVRYLEFGWGDAGFYQASEITTGLTLQSLLWPTESVMHVVSVPGAPMRIFAQSEIKRLCLDADRYAALLAFIASGFARDAAGEVVALKHGIYGNSQFYRGAGSYHAFNTCNTWTATGLQQAGVDIAARFTLTASGVMRALAVDRSCGEAVPQ